jgi:RNase PH
MSYNRLDNRTLDQLRNTKITPNISPYAEGSALIEVGGTKVICTASVEDRVPMFMRNKGIGWVTAEYAMLPRATNTRTQRETQRPSGPNAGDPATDRTKSAGGRRYFTFG